MTNAAGRLLGSVVRARVDRAGWAAVAYTDARGDRQSAIVVGSEAGYRAFVNRCPHWGVPLAPLRGPFLDDAGRLRCLSHGARFRPDDGACVDGPCPGASLDELDLTIHPDRIDVHAPSGLSLAAAPTLRLAPRTADPNE